MSEILLQGIMDNTSFNASMVSLPSTSKDNDLESCAAIKRSSTKMKRLSHLGPLRTRRHSLTFYQFKVLGSSNRKRRSKRHCALLSRIRHQESALSQQDQQLDSMLQCYTNLHTEYEETVYELTDHKDCIIDLRDENTELAHTNRKLKKKNKELVALDLTQKQEILQLSEAMYTDKPSFLLCHICEVYKDSKITSFSFFAPCAHAYCTECALKWYNSNAEARANDPRILGRGCPQCDVGHRDPPTALRLHF